MNYLNKIKYILFLIPFFLVNCSSDNDGPIDNQPEEVSPVVFDINLVPYEKLSDYKFFKGNISDLDPVFGVLPFQPASQLFTDYAKKQRFIWMPEGVSGNHISDDQVFDFPVGTVLIKNFYYENVLPSNSKKIIETRLMIRKAEEWIFANYIWNDAQTEAILNLEGASLEISWNENGIVKNTNYKIPNENECFMCHYANNQNIPIGPKPQNLNFPINFADGFKNQIEKLKEFGYVNSEVSTSINSIVDYNDTSKSLDLRARSYLEINCANCHRDGGYAEFYPVRLNFTPQADYAALGFCLEPNITYSVPEATHIFHPGDHTKSAVFYRMNSLDLTVKMPMIGTTMIHEEGVSLINNWINSFEKGCE